MEKTITKAMPKFTTGQNVFWKAPTTEGTAKTFKGEIVGLLATSSDQKNKKYVISINGKCHVVGARKLNLVSNA